MTGRVPCLDQSDSLHLSVPNTREEDETPPRLLAADSSSLTSGTLQNAINTKDIQGQYPEVFAVV